VHTVRAWAGRGKGKFTAELHLVREMEVTIEEWGKRGHLTIWGDPLILARAATDILSVDEETSQ